MTDDRFTALYRTHGPAIFARCLRLLRDEAGAEDATQETFLKVHRHFSRAPPGQEARLWIFRIATNVCLSVLRRRASQRDARSAPETVERGIDDVLADRELAARIAARAPPRLGRPALLHFVDGFDQGEIAELLGVSRRTVINRLRAFRERALKLVRQETQ